MSYSVIEFQTYPYFAKESMRSIIKILEITKNIFVINKDDAQTKIESLLDKAYVFLSEGSDFTYEKVFETPHPYPRGESYQKD